MKFSVHVPTAAEGLAHPIPFAAPDDFARIGVAAERWGFDGVWGNDHQTTQQYVRERWPQPPSYYDILIALSFIAAATERIHLGTALLVPALRMVPIVAKQAATLDQMSGGRLRLGLGLGAYREEFDAVHPDGQSSHRGRWLDEAIEALHLLFEQREATFQGRYVRFQGIESFPKPRQKPLPIYVGGHNLNTIERAARWGHGWLPGWQPLPEMERRIALLRRLEGEIGRTPGEVEVAPQFSVTIGATQEKAEAAYWDSGIVQHRISLGYTGRDLSKQVEANLIGSPEAIVEKVQRYAEMGVQHCCALWFSTDTVEIMLDQMQWFAESVIRKTNGSLEAALAELRRPE